MSNSLTLFQKIRYKVKVYQRRLQRYRSPEWFNNRYVSDVSPIIIGGAPRSGTTLMRVMIDTHHRLCCGPESWLFTNREVEKERLIDRFGLTEAMMEKIYQQAHSREAFIEQFFAEYMRLQGKARWAEKTPQNVIHLDRIFRAFPNAYFIHMIRDGRDVACSIRTHPTHKTVDGQLVPVKTWRPIAECIQEWVDSVQAARAFRSRSNYIEVRYEELVLDTETQLKRLMGALGEAFDEAMLAYHTIQTDSRNPAHFPNNEKTTRPVDTAAFGRWETDLSEEDKVIVKERAGDLLIELDYCTDLNW